VTPDGGGGSDSGVDGGAPPDAGPADSGQADSGPVDAGMSLDAGPDSGCPSVERVQVAYTLVTSASGNTLSLGLNRPQRPGDFVLVAVNYDPVGCRSVSSISDTAGDGYAQILPAEIRGGTASLETWGAASVDGGANQVTVTFAASCLDAGQNVKIMEYAGLTSAPVDVHVSAQGNSLYPTAMFAVAQPDLLVAISADDKAAFAPGAGWTLDLIDQWSTLVEEQLAPIAGSYPVSYTANTAEDYVIQAVALRTCGSTSRTQIGITNLLGTTGHNSSGIFAQQFTASTAGTVQSIDLFLDALSSNDAGASIEFGLYADDGGVPGARLAASASVTNPMPGGWLSLAPEPPVNVVDGGIYWMAYEVSGIQIQYRTGAVAGIQTCYKNQGYGAMPASFPTPTCGIQPWSFYTSVQP